MYFIKVKFTKGLTGLAYQQVNDIGYVIAYRDELGNVLEMPEAIECHVVDDDPTTPEWVNDLLNGSV